MNSQQGERQIPAAADDRWAWDATRPLPKRVQIAIVGGGIVGTTAAWELAQRGFSVCLCEKGRIAGEQSGRNWGWVRQQGRSPVELPLMIQSLARWQSLAEELQADVGFVQRGCLYVAADDAELAAYERWLDVARAHGLDTRLLGTAETAALLPASPRAWRGALYTASDGRAEPGRAALAIAAAAERAGARIATHCAALGIESQAGRVQALVTEHGEVQCEAVLCAGGAWSRLFCALEGVDLPQLTVQGTVARLAPVESPLGGCAYGTRLAIRRRADGGYSVAHGSRFTHSLTPATLRQALRFWPAMRQEIGAIRLRFDAESRRALRGRGLASRTDRAAFTNERVLDPAPDAFELDYLRREIDATWPALAAAPIVESWGGIIETSPDVLPIISAVAARPGLFVATGFSGHGFGIGPAAGKLAADLVSGTAYVGDAQRFRLGRFFDGSPIVPGPTI